MTARFCLVCGARASDRLGIRARYGKQADARWAPDLGAWLCTRHALSGAEIEISYRPNNDGIVLVRTHLDGGPTGTVVRHRIAARTQGGDEQGELW